MPWSNQRGSWQGGGQGGGGQGPWGRGPGGPRPPDLEELLRKGQDKIKRFMPSGVGGTRGLFLIIAVVLAVWLSTGLYRVQPGEVGVEMLFGKFVKTTTPGLNYWFPGPIGEALTPNVERTNQITIGFRGAGDVGGRTAGGRDVRDVPQESLMITGDLNVIDIDFIVQWRIKDAAAFLFNIRDPEATVKIVAESAMREVIGQARLEDALTVRRQEIEQQTRELLQQILDDYGAGVLIADLKLQKVDPPGAVIDSFNDVQRARQDKERKQNEAEAYRNRVVPTARGEAAKITQGAEAYKEKVVKEADGEANRFLAVYETYKVAKSVTIQRLYIEALEEVLRGTQKVIIDSQSSGGPGVIPYLPLPELRKRAGGTSQ
ncbi:MAG: FtsH protease activity modulator HflK [Proteobacteria bacterium]|nr:FtsH protease activity modulator HflK [Pseudomonadota bacterium]